MLSTITAAPLVWTERDDVPGDLAAPAAEHAARKVVVLLADAATQAAMAAWCTANGFDLGASFGGEPRDPAAFEFHLTLFATVGPSDLPDMAHGIDPIAVEPMGFDAFGAEQDTPVMLTWSSLRLEDMRAVMLDCAAADPTYPDFRPHVSLSYAWDGTPDLDSLVVPDMPLVFDRVEVRTLKDKPSSKGAGPSQHKDALYTLLGLLRVLGTLGLFVWGVIEVGRDIGGLTRAAWDAIADWLMGERERLLARRAELESSIAAPSAELAAIDERLRQIDEAAVALADVEPVEAA